MRIPPSQVNTMQESTPDPTSGVISLVRNPLPFGLRSFLLHMYPIGHVPHCSCVKKMSSCQKDVKLSKGCQIVKKMSNVKKSNTSTMEEVCKKINWHNEVHTYWCQFWHQIWRSPKLFKNTFYAHFEGFWWPSYVTKYSTWNTTVNHFHPKSRGHCIFGLLKWDLSHMTFKNPD